MNSNHWKSVSLAQRSNSTNFILFSLWLCQELLRDYHAQERREFADMCRHVACKCPGHDLFAEMDLGVKLLRQIKNNVAWIHWARPSQTWSHQERSPRHCHQDWEPLRGVQMGVKPSKNCILVRCFKTQNKVDNQTSPVITISLDVFETTAQTNTKDGSSSREISGTPCPCPWDVLHGRNRFANSFGKWRTTPHHGWFDSVDRRLWSLMMFNAF